MKQPSIVSWIAATGYDVADIEIRGKKQPSIQPSIVSWIAATVIMFTASSLILTAYWSWFVVPIFHVSDISFWAIVGLRLFVVMCLYDAESMIEEQLARHVQRATLEACVPLNQREELKAKLGDLGGELSLWRRAALSVAISFVMLVVGFVIRLFM